MYPLDIARPTRYNTCVVQRGVEDERTKTTVQAASSPGVAGY